MESNVHTWSPDWIRNLTLATQAIGYADVTSLLAAMPGKPYREIAQALGSTFAPIQIIRLQYDEAKRRGMLRDAAKDALTRNLVEALPAGWGTGENTEWSAILGLSSWSSELQVSGACPELKPVIDEVINTLRRYRIPRGWRPTHPNDPIIAEVFNNAWPASKN
jgi:hypothetical protein